MRAGIYLGKEVVGIWDLLSRTSFHCATLKRRFARLPMLTMPEMWLSKWQTTARAINVSAKASTSAMKAVIVAITVRGCWLSQFI